MIHTFNGIKYLSLSDKSCIEEIADIGNVVDESATMGEGSIKIVQGEIVGIMNTEAYNNSRVCKAKVMAVNDIISECSKCAKCAMKVNMNRCGKSEVARFMIEDSQQKIYDFSAFVIEAIVEGTDGTDDVHKMLGTPTMTFTITDKDIVASVAK